jgi:uncharacterized SAM-binding protein YcdF (DUF218 family)
LLALLLASAALAALAVDFARRTGSTAPATGPLPATAVVFTGQFARVHAGLSLLREGRVARLFISGVNPGAGIRVQGFADQFGLDAGLREALATGRLLLGPHAQTTAENAVETACWFRAQGLTGPVVLITGRAHMPRASLALERALPGAEVVRWPLPPDLEAGPARTLVLEFGKYAGTRLGFANPSARMPCRSPAAADPAAHRANLSPPP